MVRKRFIWKSPEAIGDLTGDKIANKITKVSKNSQQNNLETVTNEYDKEMPKEKFLKRDKRLLLT